MNDLFNIVMNKATKTATIDIDGFIGFDWSKGWTDEGEKQNTKERIKKQLKDIGSIKADKIIVNINSYGGDVNHGISIHDLLAENPAHITTKMNGMSASAATVIGQCGDIRQMSDNGLYLIHKASTMMWGNDVEISADLANLRKVDECLVNIYVKKSGKTAEEIREIMSRGDNKGEWLTSTEALELGLIDEIFEPTAIAAFADPATLANMKLPALPKAFTGHLPPAPEEDGQTNPPKASPDGAEASGGASSFSQNNKLPEQLGNIKDADNPQNSKKEENDMNKDDFLNMKNLFGAELAAEYLEGDMSFEDAKSDYIGKLKTNVEELTATNDAQGNQIVDFEKEVTDLKAEVSKLKDGADPIPGNNSNEAIDGEIATGGEDKDTFMDKVQKIQNEKKCSRTDAISDAVNQFPELHEAFKNPVSE